MDAAELERVSTSFECFHAQLAPSFGLIVWQEHCRNYVRALLVQSGERRNAENLGEAVGLPARVMQWFLTQARWDDDVVIAGLQRYLGPRLKDAQADWIVDESGFPKQGKKSVGVARQYCGHLGKVASCQVGILLAHVGPRGRAIVDKRLYLPEKWIQDEARCQAAEVPKAVIAAGYQSKSELALGLLKRAQEIGALVAQWVLADDEYGKSPAFRDGVARLGLWYMLEVPSNTLIWLKSTAEDPTGRCEVRQRATALSSEHWQAITVAEGEQGPRTYLFAFERLWDNRDHGPGKGVWAVYRKNLDGSEPRYYFSNAPARTRNQVLAKKAAARWPIETEIQTNKSDVGLDEYEVRSWQGWNHHMTLCLLASAFLLTLQQDWGGKAAPDHPAPGLSDGARAVAAQALLTRRPHPLA